ncbi:tail fiber domain-containing protein [Brevibacillus laterosporus]|uniref:tail fiber domain-containing protein n=1 Tax=Brevibacillus laterosporus TaxID=1465 RepID=UPI000EAD534A|nr:tail fiber domain-containing protein [Brevibacillus laterosporus]AYK07561.1 tail fiber domain-containing protein [Brevibacillus laterosporus]
MANLIGSTSEPGIPGVLGENTNQTDAAGVGVHGKSKAAGVVGESETWHGVVGFSQRTTGGIGEFGSHTTGGTGVAGESTGWIGVYGKSTGTVGGATGIMGEGAGGGTASGVGGKSQRGIGVWGLSTYNSGVEGKSENAVGIYAESTWNTALAARSHRGDLPALAVNHRDRGDLILGIDNRNVEVFRVYNNGDVHAHQFVPTSDKNTKENFSSVNTLEILDNLASMPIQSWNYKEDSSSKRHIGPTAQDFHAAFGLNGDDNRLISSIDLQGVALVAIQGLNKKLKAENAELHANLAKLEARLSALESKG